MHPRRWLEAVDIGGFPRTRGDAPDAGALYGAIQELPPHTRGCTLRAALASEGADASPAHAGMHPRIMGRVHVLDRFPRTRGDAPYYQKAQDAALELPPHTRGCTPDEIDLRG